MNPATLSALLKNSLALVLSAGVCLTATAQASNSGSTFPATGSTRVVTLGTQGGPLPSGSSAQPANAVVVDGSIYPPGPSWLRATSWNSENFIQQIGRPA